MSEKNLSEKDQNIHESSEQKHGRPQVAGPVWELKKIPLNPLSPVTELSVTFRGANIATPTTSKSESKQTNSFGGESKINMKILKNPHKSQKQRDGFTIMCLKRGLNVYF